MRVTKCDLCSKEIKKGDLEIVAGTSFFKRFFCVSCGFPVFKFLKKHKFIKEDSKAKSDKAAN